LKRLFLSNQARQDLREIWQYSLRKWGQQQADRYVAAIRVTFDSLLDGSASSRPADAIRPDMRRVSVGRHVVFFRDADERVEVVRVLHERIDFGARV
jgi:toxin ParE1/3/4